MKFVLASHNKGKIKEMQEVLGELGVEVVTPGELGITVDVEETGTTFAENAALKARAIRDASGLPAIADDSGLCVNWLSGAPGVYSARYAGEHGNDEKNNELLLENLSDVPADKRTARFVSTVCCCFPDGRHMTVRGECEGKIAFEPKGEGGFGYDPVFYLPELEKTYAELAPEEKNAISHRARALQAFCRIYREEFEHDDK